MSQPGSGQCTEGTFVCFIENRAGNFVLVSHCGSLRETSAPLIAAQPLWRHRERTRLRGPGGTPTLSEELVAIKTEPHFITVKEVGPD